MRIVSHEEQWEYLKKASVLVHDVALVIVETGMRPEEVFRLRAEEVNLAHRYLKITKGKTRFARRNVPLTESAADILKQRIAKAKGPYLFPHRSDPNRPQNNIDRGHHKTVREAGIQSPFRLYDFRHMGHSSITTTMRYVHPTPEHKRKAVDKLEQFNFAQMSARTEQRESLQKSLQ